MKLDTKPQLSLIALAPDVRRSRALRRWGLAAALLGAFLGAAHASALAAGARYGEVTRFGGPDQTGHTPGKFVEPVGFAVEAEDKATGEKNDVYVLDETKFEIVKRGGLGEGEGVLDYRLQKLSSSGAVLGSTTFKDGYTDTEEFSDMHPVFGLAVDPVSKRVYTTVEANVPASGGGKLVPVAQELVAWSTEPAAGNKLVAAGNGLGADQVTKSAELIAGADGVSSLMPSAENAGEDMYSPDGLAVDQASHDVAIEAQKGARQEGSVLSPGPTVLQRIVTEGAEAGSLGARWESTTNYPAGGLFTAAAEGQSFGVDLDDFSFDHAAIARITSVAANFGSEAPIVDPESPLYRNTGSNGKQEVLNLDEAPALPTESSPNRVDEAQGESSAFPYAAGSPVAQLDGAGDPYAAVYRGAHGGSSIEDPQAQDAPWVGVMEEQFGSVPEDEWLSGENRGQRGNVGIRIFEQGGGILQTLGDGKPSPPGSTPAQSLGSCNFDSEDMSLAAGAEGVLFVLTQPRENDADGAIENDEVIELAPGAAHSCPSVSGKLTVEQNHSAVPVTEVEGPDHETEEQVTVHAGLAVEFSALSLDRPQTAWTLIPGHDHVFEYSPFEFAWSFGDAGGHTAVAKMESKTAGEEAKPFFWPSPQASFTYEESGTFQASVRVYGDFGTYSFPLQVVVTGGSKRAVAAFSPPAAITAGEPATFDASASTPTEGATIEAYEWTIAHGSAPPEVIPLAGSEPLFKHKFLEAGEYSITLTIHDSAGKQASTEQHVTVAAAPGKEPEPPANTGPTNTGSSSGSTGTGSTSTGPTTGVSGYTSTHHTSPVKPLTVEQKLAKALKTCRKLKHKRQRLACERAAHKRYPLKPKPKKKKKKKK